MAPPARAEAIPQAIAPNIITSLKWLETNNLFNNLIQRNQSAAFSSGKVRPNHETNINIIARRTGKDVNSHTVLDGIITTIMATIQRINIRSEERFSRNAETDLVCRLLLEKKNRPVAPPGCRPRGRRRSLSRSGNTGLHPTASSRCRPQAG